jgi:hypothetical protein
MSNVEAKRRGRPAKVQPTEDAPVVEADAPDDEVPVAVKHDGPPGARGGGGGGT